MDVRHPNRPGVFDAAVTLDETVRLTEAARRLGLAVPFEPDQSYSLLEPGQTMDRKLSAILAA